MLIKTLLCNQTKNMKQFIFSFTMLLFLKNSTIAQTPTISSDSIIVKLTITNKEGKPIETLVTFENANPKDSKKTQTNKEGKATCILSTGESYVVSIPNTEDTYEYSIPEFGISPVSLDFKFNVTEKRPQQKKE